MSLIRKHVAVLQAWACLDLVKSSIVYYSCQVVMDMKDSTSKLIYEFIEV